MDISIEYFKSIAKSLPISYYAKRPINLIISDKENTSFYNPFRDSITLSYAAMKHMFDYMEDDSPEVEQIIRSVLYHEVSHALITPEDLMGSEIMYQLWRNAMNIIEDERIETMFRNFYHGINFRKSIILLNNYKGEKPNDAFSAFYYVVRFKHGKKELIFKANKLIKKYLAMTKTASWSKLHDFKFQTWDLVLECAKDWYENNDKDALLKEEPKYDSLGYDLQKKIVEKVLTKNEEPTGRPGDTTEPGGGTGGTPGTVTKGEEGEEGEGGKEGEEDEGGKEGEGDPTSKGKGFTGIVDPTHKPGEDPSETGEGEKEAPDIDSILDGIEKEDGEAGTVEIDDGLIQEMWETTLNEFNDDKLTQKIEFIITSMQRRNKKSSSSARRGYSGKLDPKAVGREDWKIFIKKADRGDIRGFGKFHLNLFIDTSGSYWDNETNTNKILKSLDILERKYPFFDFDLVTCQISEHIQDKDHRYIHADGGNDLDEVAFDIFKKLQKKDAYNYNIVLFDGDAFSDSYYIHGNGDHCRNFGAFNASNCTIISDASNKNAIETYAPKAHHIFAGYGSATGRGYSQALFENILTAMHRILI